MARKRAAGEGTIYHRADGRYEVALRSLTTAGTYKRIRRYAKTRAAADELLTELKHQAQQGVPVPDKTWRLDAYLDYWLEEVVKPGRRYATYSQCERAARLYLKPELGTLPLLQVSVQTIQRFVNEKLASGYSVPHVQVMKKVLSAALTNAMREEHIVRNPARLVTLPTYEADEYEPWTADEARQFLDAAQAERLYPAFLLLLVNGLRRGELLGLVWRDIDLTWGVLHLRRQLQRSDHGLQLAPLKTKASKRDLALHTAIVAALRAHQEHQLEEQQAEGVAWTGPRGGEGFVFPAEHGSPMESSTLRRAFDRICRENGIRHVRIHDARDGLATLLDEMDVPVKQTQAILGHSRITTTLEHYIHPRAAKQRAIMDQVGAKLLPENKTDDTDSCRPGDARSRQSGRQSSVSGSLHRWLFSGAGEGTLTPGLVLGNSAEFSVQQRWTRTRLLMHHRTCAALLGVVAVSAGRQSPPASALTTVRRSPPVSASRFHVIRHAGSRLC